MSWRDGDKRGLTGKHEIGSWEWMGTEFVVDMLALKFRCWEKKSLWWSESPATCSLSSFLSLLPHRNCPWSSKCPPTHLFTRPSAHAFTLLSTMHPLPSVYPPTHLFISSSMYLLTAHPFTHLPSHSTFPEFLPWARDMENPGPCLGGTHTSTGAKHRALSSCLFLRQPSLNHRAGLPESTFQSVHF